MQSRHATCAALALVLSAGPAGAYTFEQTSITGNGLPVVISFSVYVPDGITVSRSDDYGRFGSPVFGSPERPLDLPAGMGFFGLPVGPFAASDGWNPTWDVSLTGEPAGVSGHIDYFGEYDDFTLDLASAPALTTGTYITDQPNGCHVARGCSFVGLLIDPPGDPVPEPPAALLLGTAILMAGFLRGRMIR